MGLPPTTQLRNQSGCRSRQMQILAFAIFLLISHFLLTQIFKITTYHNYFLKALPLLVGYSALVG